MNDEFVNNLNNNEPSDMFKRFAEDVMTFDSDREFNEYLEEHFRN